MKRIMPSRTGTVISNGMEINFEAFGDSQNATILLIMGNGVDHTLWPPEFYEPLVEAGYYVVSFDNRDVGGSTWISDWDENRPYTLEDMALDTVGLLDALGIEKAYVIGISMGGQIAQRVALSHAEHVLTLTLLSSTGFIFDQDPAVHPDLFRQVMTKLEALAAQYPNFQTDDYDAIEYNVGMWKNLAGSRFPFDEAFYRDVFVPHRGGRALQSQCELPSANGGDDFRLPIG